MYNKTFELNISDIDLIENLLRSNTTESNSASYEKLLAKLHHQKTWYRPKDGTYISG